MTAFSNDVLAEHDQARKAAIAEDDRRRAEALAVERNPGYQAIRAETANPGLVCPVCSRLLDSEHKLLVVEPVAWWTESMADAHRRGLCRILLGLDTDPPEGSAMIWLARLMHWTHQQGAASVVPA